MRRNDLDRRIALADRIRADDITLAPLFITTFDKAKPDPMAQGRRVGDRADPAFTIARNLIGGTENSTGVEDLPPVAREDSHERRPVLSLKFGTMAKGAADV